MDIMANAVDLGVLNIFYMHETYFYSHINSLHKINSIQAI